MTCESEPPKFLQEMLPGGANKLLWGGIACLIAILALRLPLTSSFWLDEAVSMWLARSDWWDLVPRAVIYQAQSPLYFLLLKLWPLAEWGELGCRLLSLFGGLGTLVILTRLGSRIFGSGVKPLMVLFALSNRDFILASIQTRPYSLALLAATSAVYALLRWGAGGERKWLLVHLVASILTFYLHYLFALIAITFPPILWHYRRATWIRYYWLVIIVGILATVPGLYHVYWWSQRSNTVQFAPLPTLETLLLTLVPVEVGLSLACSFIIATTFSRQALKSPAPFAAILSLVWVVAGSLVLFGIAHLTGVGIFLKRYLGWRVGGVVLGSLVLLDVFRCATARQAFVVTYWLLALHGVLTKEWAVEDWRKVAVELAGSQDEQVVVYSGLVESESITQSSSPLFKDYLSSPLLVYDIDRARLIPIPGEPLAPAVVDYSKSILPSVTGLEGNKEWWLIVNDEPLYSSRGVYIDPLTEIVHFFQVHGVRCDGVGRRTDAAVTEGIVKVLRCSRDLAS